MSKTTIQWTDYTENPLTGCTKVGPECLNCYAATASASPRLQQFEKYQGVVDERGNWTGAVKFHPEVLHKIYRSRKPRRIFMPSMSDPFHDAVRDDWLHHIFATVALCPHITFQVLTKRSERMMQYFSDLNTPGMIVNAAMRHYGVEGLPEGWFPMRNLWLGVSAGIQSAADERIPHILATPAAVRFVSCEPLLEPVTVLHLLKTFSTREGTNGFVPNQLHQIIMGGESGPGCRPCDADWFRSLVAECRLAGISPFVKQWGSYALDGGVMVRTKDSKGGNKEDLPVDVRVREFPV